MPYLSNILIFMVLVILPFVAFQDLNKLKKNSKPEIKERAYFKIFFWYVFITVGFMGVSPVKDVFLVTTPISFNVIFKISFLLVSFYLLFTQVFPIFLLFYSKKFRFLTTQSFDEKSYIFPTTDRQRTLFWIVPFTVGIGEEIIFRGYLYQYFQSAPYSMSALVSFLLVTVIFGLGHFQQGINGIILTTLLGFFLGYLYFLTGNLLLSIILHILFDAKILFISSTLNKYKINETKAANM